MKHVKRLERLIQHLTPLERAELLVTGTARTRLGPLLWDTMPDTHQAEVDAHIDLARRLMHILRAQARHVDARVDTLYASWSTVHVLRAWGTDRYLLLSAGDAQTRSSRETRLAEDTIKRGPSHPDVMLDIKHAALDLTSEWDTYARDLALQIRTGLQEAAGMLLACEQTADALKAHGPFAGFIDRLLHEEFSGCRAHINALRGEMEQVLGAIPPPGPDPDTADWLSTIFQNELAGRWPGTEADEPLWEVEIVKAPRPAWAQPREQQD